MFSLKPNEWTLGINLQSAVGTQPTDEELVRDLIITET